MRLSLCLWSSKSRLTHSHVCVAWRQRSQRDLSVSELPMTRWTKHGSQIPMDSNGNGTNFDLELNSLLKSIVVMQRNFTVIAIFTNGIVVTRFGRHEERSKHSVNEKRTVLQSNWRSRLIYVHSTENSLGWSSVLNFGFVDFRTKIICDCLIGRSSDRCHWSAFHLLVNDSSLMEMFSGVAKTNDPWKPNWSDDIVSRRRIRLLTHQLKWVACQCSEMDADVFRSTINSSEGEMPRLSSIHLPLHVSQKPRVPSKVNQ